jgi:hypothetical protein
MRKPGRLNSCHWCFAPQATFSRPGHDGLTFYLNAESCKMTFEDSNDSHPPSRIP